jgi:hypothetical protein
VKTDVQPICTLIHNMTLNYYVYLQLPYRPILDKPVRLKNAGKTTTLKSLYDIGKPLTNGQARPKPARQWDQL